MEETLKEQLAELRQLLAQISGGPWEDKIDDEGYLYVADSKNLGLGFGVCGMGDLEEVDGVDCYNARFIALSRNAMSAILTKLQELGYTF